MRRLLVPADVPIHRPSVGAMALASGLRMPNPVKHYTYRGTGEDQYEVVIVPPKPKPKPKRKPRRLSDETYYKRYDAPKPRARVHDQPALPHPPYAPPTTRPKRKPWSSPRPAPGWRPTSGALIDDLLRGLDDD